MNRIEFADGGEAIVNTNRGSLLLTEDEDEGRAAVALDDIGATDLAIALMQWVATTTDTATDKIRLETIALHLEGLRRDLATHPPRATVAPVTDFAKCEPGHTR